MSAASVAVVVTSGECHEFITGLHMITIMVSCTVEYVAFMRYIDRLNTHWQSVGEGELDLWSKQNQA